MSSATATVSAPLATAIAVFAAAASAALIVLLFPLLRRYALAKPNARSSHHTPTPQGGGIAVIAATLGAVALALGLGALSQPVDARLAAMMAAAASMALVGAVDDIHPLAVAPRLAMQIVIVAGVIYAVPAELRAAPFLPWWLERLLLVLGGLWFVNLVNFMDGIDWMTVAEVVPLSATLAALGAVHALPIDGFIAALALGGAVLGFAYFNRPIAKVFLGDVGSLPIGLMLGWLLLLLASSGHLAAAIIMPLYYLADASLTLLRRLLKGAPVWQAHRVHFYQLATDRGFDVRNVVGAVFVVNVCLCTLAVITVMVPSPLADLGALVAAGALVASLLAAFARGRK
jgi:UDP-N-acetylmuramyl pentapeptide phosphotransferase/UDP-N-acetylglucosamine-1-phosphate transferase